MLVDLHSETPSTDNWKFGTCVVDGQISLCKVTMSLVCRRVQSMYIYLLNFIIGKNSVGHIPIENKKSFDNFKEISVGWRLMEITNWRPIGNYKRNVDKN